LLHIQPILLPPHFKISIQNDYPTNAISLLISKIGQLDHLTSIMSGHSSRCDSVKRESIGRKTVYHCTTIEAGTEIQKTGRMKPGRRGMFGGAIYFADTKESARHKAAHGPRDGVVITAIVNFGMALVLEAPDSGMTAERLRSYGCNSIKGRSSPTANWEYVVFDPSPICFEEIEITSAGEGKGEAKGKGGGGEAGLLVLLLVGAGCSHDSPHPSAGIRAKSVMAATRAMAAIEIGSH
jgi:hypothetical protein